MYRTILMSLFAVISLATFVVRAADLPTVVDGAEDYDKSMCIKQYTDNCISTICITSSALDCNDKCQAAAEDKCEEQADD